jgi:hypothetical protein
MSDDMQVPDPMTAMAEGAAQLHEMYTAYMDAGFTEQRAFDLVSQFLATFLDS